MNKTVTKLNFKFKNEKWDTEQDILQHTNDSILLDTVIELYRATTTNYANVDNQLKTVTIEFCADYAHELKSASIMIDAINRIVKVKR